MRSPGLSEVALKARRWAVSQSGADPPGKGAGIGGPSPGWPAEGTPCEGVSDGTECRAVAVGQSGWMAAAVGEIGVGNSHVRGGLERQSG